MEVSGAVWPIYESLGVKWLKQFEVRVQVEMEESVFIRRFEINSCGKSLALCQKKVGDVSCVIWDAALVVQSICKPDVMTCKISFEAADQL